MSIHVYDAGVEIGSTPASTEHTDTLLMVLASRLHVLYMYSTCQKRRLQIGRDSSRLLREDKIANPPRLYYREVRKQCKYLCAYVRPLYIVRIL